MVAFTGSSDGVGRQKSTPDVVVTPPVVRLHVSVLGNPGVVTRETTNSPSPELGSRSARAGDGSNVAVGAGLVSPLGVTRRAKGKTRDGPMPVYATPAKASADPGVVAVAFARRARVRVYVPDAVGGRPKEHARGGLAEKVSLMAYGRSSVA